MTYDELYELAMNGNADALEELNAKANSGDDYAQYVISCVYDNIDSPFCNVELGMSWLQKSAGNGNEFAQKKIKEMPRKARIQYGLEKAEKSETEEKTIIPTGKDLLSFDGRIDRVGYFVYFFVYLFAFGIVLYLISLLPKESVSDYYGYYESYQPTGFAKISDLIVRLAAGYLYLTLCVKRMHDCGHSGWWVLIPFCPIALFFMKGEDKTNEYGPAID